MIRHTGESETSQILAISPDLVRREVLRADGEGMPMGRLNELRAAGLTPGIWWYADQPTHYKGDGVPATAVKGDRLFDAIHAHWHIVFDW